MNVCEGNMCTGCMACLEICPKDAVVIKDNMDGYNAEINEQLCIDCGACHRICQQNCELVTLSPKMWKQGWSQGEKIRENSSSGGLGYTLIKSFIENYGMVCACKFYEGEFVYEFVQTVDDIKDYIGSKYVKSSPKGVYKRIKEYLFAGNKVLFIGLPCHVAAVKLYCGEKLLDNLFTVDLICHGTPSPKLLELFLREYKCNLLDVTDIKFRIKENFGLRIDYKKITPWRVPDMYTFAFLKGLDYTENCYSCKYAKLERVSDITIGDSWGSDLSKEQQALGISLILCQTEKGKSLLEKLNLHLENVDLENAINNNKQLQRPTQQPDKRKEFFKYIKTYQSFSKSVARCYPKNYYKQKLKVYLIKFGIIKAKK